MPLFAIVNNNKVLNIIVTDEKEQAEKDTGCTLIEYTLDEPACVGDIYFDGKFYSSEEFEELNKEQTDA